MSIRQILLSATLACAASLAQAIEIQPYSVAALAAAQQAGGPVALHFHADWCPTCRTQQKVLQALKGEKGLDLTVLTADYDTEKDPKRQFKVNARSTLVVLKGQQVAARLIGETRTEAMRAALKSAL